METGGKCGAEKVDKARTGDVEGMKEDVGEGGGVGRSGNVVDGCEQESSEVREVGFGICHGFAFLLFVGFVCFVDIGGRVGLGLEFWLPNC